MNDFYKILFILLLSQLKNSVYAQRDLGLRSVINVRDLGGYKSADGRCIQFGKIIRAGKLSNLTNIDSATLSNYPLIYIFDFRGPLEIKAAPDKPINGAKWINLPAGSDHAGDTSLNHFFESSDSAIIAGYKDLTPFVARYKPVFDTLLNLNLNRNGAILFHCSAGKDRTGLMAALLLYALDVPYTTIENDYMLSNKYRYKLIKKNIKKLMLSQKISKIKAEYLLGVSPSYLKATFDEINKQFGSIDNYLSSQFGLDKQKRTQLKLKYLK